MRRDRTLRTEGIVLRRTNFGEADRLITLYTQDAGKIRAIAKGARKPQSRKTGHIELFMRSKFLIATGRNLDIITQAELIEPNRNLNGDLVRTTYAAYACELLDQFTPDEERHAGIYQLLASGMNWFNESDNLLLAARYFELRLLSLVGYQPQLFYCVVSGEPIEQEEQYFSGEEGGFIKPEHRRRDPNAKRVSAAAVKVLRYLQTRNWETVKNLQLRRDLHQELEMIMHFYLQHLLEREVKSADFLYRLRRESKLTNTQ